MKPMLVCLRKVSIPALALAICIAPSFAQRVKLVEHEGTIDVTIAGQPFTTYHFDDDFFHPPVRPFFWPVLASDGAGITTDQQQTDPRHGYQRSIWIGHGDVNGANHWKFNASPQPRQRHVKFDWMHRNGFREELIWDGKAGEPMLRETRTVKFRGYKDGVRAIEFKLAFTPVAEAVTFGTRGDHGLLSVRLLESLYGNPQFTSAEGTDRCAVPPQPKPKPGGAPLPAAEELAPIHTAWCDESGETGGTTYGVAIFDHPENPRHPPMWHAWANARLATDMFEPDKAGPMKQGPLTIAPGTTFTVRYEVLVHKGPASSAGLQKKYAEFSASN
jgi:hypothetical protein